MEQLIGKRTRCGTIEKASKDGRLLAIYSQWSLGNKGSIWAQNVFDDSTYRGVMPTLTINGVGYHVVEYCVDFPFLMRRFDWHITNPSSAYYEG